ncbi:MAG: UbiA family prenyltransferase [Thermoplasmata archaeon]
MKEHVMLIRPPLFILGFFASFAVLSYTKSFDLSILLAVGFGNAAMTVLNEIRDVDVDRIGKPHKPLPSGKVSVRYAWAVFSTFLTISLISVLLLPPNYKIIAVVGLLSALVYNLGFKALFGNIFLGTSYFCAVYLSSHLKMLDFSLGFALFTIAFNLAVQLQDFDFDRKVGMKTFPVVYGKKVTYISSFCLAITSILLLTSLPLFTLPPLFVIISLITKRFEFFDRILARVVLILAFMYMVVISYV